MKRLLSISFVCVLLMNGAGGVLAATLCLGLRCSTPDIGNKRSAHPGAESSGAAHCAGTAEPSGHGGHHAPAVAGEKIKPAAETGPVKEAAAKAKVNSHCGHCVSAPQSPARSGFKASASESRRDPSPDTQQPARRFVLPAVASFPALRPSQGAPPAQSSRRHLLVNVFLI
jgi:hypothetical protein